MTRRALINNEPVYIDTTRDRLEIEEAYREKDLFCDCSARLFLVNGKRKRRYNLSLSDGSSMKKVDFDLI